MEEHFKEVCLPENRIQKMNSFQASTMGECIEFADDDLAWLASAFSDKIYLYNSKGEEVRSIKVPGSGGIRGMTVKNNDDIIVTCMDKKVRRVSLDGRITALFEVAPFCPEGVCLTDKEEIVVCMSGQEDKNHVAVYAPDGNSKVREITARDGHNKLLFTNPYRVVINDGQITVLNISDNVVSLDQQKGQLLWVYDGGQHKLNKKFYPNGMCRDKFSYLLVTDNNNHCIHYIDNKGSLVNITMVKDYGLERPWGIGVDNQSGKIWSGSCESQNVMILKY